MNPEISAGVLPREQRLRCLRELVVVLAQAQAALLALDLDRLHRHTAQQETLCVDFSAVAPSPLAADAAELRSLALEAKNLNQIQAALLRRAARTLDILASLRTRSALTYTPRGTLSHSLTPAAGKL